MRKLRAYPVAVLMLTLSVWLVSCSQETSQEPMNEPAPAGEEQAPPAATSQPAEPMPGAEAEAPAAEAPSGEAAASSGDVAAGQSVYARKCATCHGKMGEGNAAIARSMGVELHSLGSDDVQAKSDEELAGALTEGIGKMPAVAGLSDTDVQNLIAYMRSLAKE